MSSSAVRWRRSVAIACCLALTSACGARWSDEERADVFARRTAAATSGSTVVPVAATGDLAVDGSGAPIGPDAPLDAGVDAGGSAAPTGPVAATGGAKPCEAPSTAPGVTPSQLTVANLATLSGPVPGLGATALAGARAYVAYKNATGGVCGRKIVMLSGDDGNEGNRSRTLIAGFEPKALGIIGLFAPSSGAAADLLEAAKMPVTGTAGDEAIRAVSTVFNLNPPPPDGGGTIEKYRYLKSQGVTTAAIATLSAAAAVKELEQTEAQIRAAGIEIVSKQLLPVATLSFDSAARVVANSKADYLFFLGAAQHDASMARSMRATGYVPKFEEYPTGYGSLYTDLAGASAEGTSTWLRGLPAEERASNQELRTFLEWMGRASPNDPPDVFAVDAWAGSKAFFDALEQLPGPITRAALVDQLRTYTDYDAAGLIGRIDLAHSRSKGCLVGVRFQDGAWTRIAPAQGFMC